MILACFLCQEVYSQTALSLVISYTVVILILSYAFSYPVPVQSWQCRLVLSLVALFVGVAAEDRWSIYFQGMRKHIPPFTGSWENHLLKNVLDWDMLVSRKVFAVRTRILWILFGALFSTMCEKNNQYASQPVMISTNHPLHALRAGNKICVNCKDCPWFKIHPKKLRNKY